MTPPRSPPSVLESFSPAVILASSNLSMFRLTSSSSSLSSSILFFKRWRSPLRDAPRKLPPRTLVRILRDLFQTGKTFAAWVISFDLLPLHLLLFQLRCWVSWPPVHLVVFDKKPTLLLVFSELIGLCELFRPKYYTDPASWSFNEMVGDMESYEIPSLKSVRWWKSMSRQEKLMFYNI